MCSWKSLAVLCLWQCLWGWAGADVRAQQPGDTSGEQQQRAEIDQILNLWDKQLYNLESAGAQSAEFSAKLTRRSTLLPQALEGSFEYRWKLATGGEFNFGSLDVENSIAKGGFELSDIESFFKQRSCRPDLADCKLTLAGDQTSRYLIVDGKNREHLTEIHFDKSGLPELMHFKNPDGIRSGTKRYEYKKVGKQFTPSKLHMHLLVEKMGEIDLIAEMKFAEQGRFWVWQSYRSTVSMDKQQLAEVSIEFSQFKVQGAQPQAAGPILPKPKKEQSSAEEAVNGQPAKDFKPASQPAKKSTSQPAVPDSADDPKY